MAARVRHYKPCHNVILSEAKNLGLLLISSGIRSEMFRFAQHDSGAIDWMSSKLVPFF
jgi:hypothetical protein